MKDKTGKKKILGTDRTLSEITGCLGVIWSYLKKYRGGLFVCFAVGTAMTLVSLGYTVMSKYVIDSVIEKNVKLFLLAAVCSVVLYVVSTAVNIFVSKKRFNIILSATNDIRRDVFRKIFNISWESLLSYRPGDLINRVNGDTRTLADGFITTMFSLLSNLVVLTGSVIIIIRYDVVFAVIALLGAPCVALCYKLLMKKLQKLTRETKVSESEVMAYTSETVYNLQTVKSFCLSGQKLMQLTAVLNKNKDVKTKHNNYSIFVNTVTGVLGVIASYACVAWAIYRLWNGKISYGTMTMFIQLSAFMMSSLKGLIGFFPSVINITTSVMRIKEVTDDSAESDNNDEEAAKTAARLGKKTGGIVFDGVSASYKTKPGVLKDVSFRINSGETVAVIGRSGAGKTTLFRIMLGLIEPDAGTAKLLTQEGDTRISPVTRKLFAYVPQHNSVFSGTVAENIGIVNPGMTVNDINRCLELACCTDFVNELPDGINTQIGENGCQLSSGQVQRLAIARALACDAPVLLFDEATSALDSETEKAVLERIAASGENKICIFSTHRFAVLDTCDRIYKTDSRTVKEISNEEAKEFCLNTSL